MRGDRSVNAYDRRRYTRQRGFSLLEILIEARGGVTAEEQALMREFPPVDGA